jgi:uncharacterized repeat protein (TIGR01451 family)
MNMLQQLKTALAGSLLLACIGPVSAQDAAESLFTALSAPASTVVRGGNCPAGATVIYDTTHASNQGAEITAAANGPATCMGDRVVVINHTLPVCEISVEVFTLAATTPFDMTLEIYTDCSTNGTANSPCGNGTGTLIPSSTTTVTGITPPALGTIFTVVFPVNNASLATELDDTITVKLNASRNDVFWRLGETPAIGSLPAGDPATSFVERCGSTGANNGCSRNFGINNNFAMTITGAPAASANLSITKTDGVTTATPGGSTTYTITASNAGPDAAPVVTVADTFPAPLTCTWTCVGAGGGTCTAAGSGNINDTTVNLPSGGSVTYTATCAIAASATGSLANTATVSSSTADPNPANNSATDTDTLAPSADLSITKTDGVTSVLPGGSLTYTITSSNAGPSDAPGSTVADTFPASLTCTWTCVGAGGGTCTANGSGNISDTVNLPAGGSVTHTASCAVSGGASGTIVNTATVAAGAGVTDPNPANNSATDTDTVASPADVTGTKTASGSFLAGSNVTYTVVLTNAGPGTQGDNAGDEFTDILPASLTLVSATASSGTALATVGTNTVTWNGSIAAAASVTITITATISPAASGTISNQGTINYDANGDGTNEATRSTDDPATGTAGDATAFGVVVPGQPIPVANWLGLAMLALLLGGVAWRRQIG